MHAVRIVLLAPALAAGLVLSLEGDPKTPSHDAPPRTDLYGDPLPPGAVARLGTTRFRKPYASYYAVAFSPDGKTLAAIDVGGQVVLWDAADGKLVHQEERPLGEGKAQSPYEVHAFAAFSPDGKALIAGLNRGTWCRPLCRWDVAKHKEVCRMEGSDDGFVAAAVSPDFKTVAAVSNERRITLWDAATGKRLDRWRELDYTVWALAFSPDGATLASGGADKKIYLWDVTTGKKRRTLEGHESVAAALAYSPDGKTLASAERGRRVILWDPETGETIRQWKADSHKGRKEGDYDGNLFALAFAPDGKTLAALDRFRAADLWEVSSGKRLHTLRGSMNCFGAFSPDGRTLAAGGEAEICLWAVADGRPRYPGPGRGLAFSSDGAVLVTGGEEGQVRRWEAATGKPLGSVDVDYLSALSGDGRLAAGVDRENKVIRLRETDGGKEIGSLKAGSPLLFPIAFSPGGKSFVARRSVENNASQLVLVDAASGEELHALGTYRPYPAGLALSPDGRLLAAADEAPAPAGVLQRGSVVHLWDVKKGKLLREAPLPAPCRALALSPDGRLLASCDSGRTVYLWEAATLEPIRQWTASDQGVEQIAFAPDGRTLASVASSGNAWLNASIQLWDVDEGKELRRFAVEDRGPFDALTFSPDGRRLAVGYHNPSGQEVLVWDVAEAAPRARPPAARLTDKELSEAWADLGAADAARAARGVQKLGRAPEDAPAFLAARRAEWERARADLNPRRLEGLIRGLADDSFAVREKATDELVELGAADALRGRLEDDKLDPETRLRLQRVLARVDGDAGPRMRWLRATEALERLGTPEARKLLEKLAADGGPVAEQAKASLERLERRPAAVP